jgi:general secretion pathway protein G
MRRRREGFTLIELLVVIAIIGILSTLAVVALNSARQRSRDAKRVSDVRQIQTALELAYSEVSSYPVVVAPVTLGDTATKVLCNEAGTPKFRADSTTAPACSTVYMGLVPSNPSPNGTPYTYSNTATGYYIGFTLEGATGQLNTGSNCANGNGITSGALTC